MGDDVTCYLLRHRRMYREIEWQYNMWWKLERCIIYYILPICIWYILYKNIPIYIKKKNKTKRWGQAKKEAPGGRSRWRSDTCAINKWLKRYLGSQPNSNLNPSTTLSHLGSTYSHCHGITRQYSGWSAWEINPPSCYLSNWLCSVLFFFFLFFSLLLFFRVTLFFF